MSREMIERALRRATDALSAVREELLADLLSDQNTI